MPQAVDTITRAMSGTPQAFTVAVSVAFPPPAGPASSSADGRLDDACRAAMATYSAMQDLLTSVSELLPGDPRHVAAYAASGLLQTRFEEHLSRVCLTRAEDNVGWRAKSALISELIDRDEHDAVLGGPAARVAASLAEDILTTETRTCSRHTGG